MVQVNLMEFVYEEEFWFISTFLNSTLIDGREKCDEIEREIKHFLNGLKKKRYLL